LDINLLFIWKNTFCNYSYPYCVRLIRFLGTTDKQSYENDQQGVLYRIIYYS